MAMATCSLLSMSVIHKFGHLQPVSNSRAVCIWRDVGRIKASGFLRRRAAVNVENVVKWGEELGAAERELRCEEGDEAAKAGCVLDRRASDPGASEVQRFLAKMGFMVAGPALTMSILDSPSIAEDGGLGSTMSGEMLRQTAILGDLDPGTAQLATSFLGPFIAILNFLFILRIVMSWYPGTPVKKFPFFLAYNPTEPLLGPTRRLIPPVGGVDVAPVIWVAVISFANEILLGKQGLLVLLSQQQP